MAVILRVAPTADRHVDEFAAFWETEVVDVAIKAHVRFGGRYAGTGPVDFMEAFALYALIRERRPARILELGFAAGVSSWVLGRALEDNASGVLDTVDVKDNGDIISPFYELAEKGTIRVHFEDALSFLQNGTESYDVTFSDALHSYEFNLRLATLLRAKSPEAIHCYHEWSLSPHATRANARYVSMRCNLGSCGERRAFESVFAHGYVHFGVPSSSGLGIVLPEFADSERAR